MRTALALLLSLWGLSLFSQNDPKVDSLKKLGRDSLIKLAIKEIDDPKFNPVNYDQVVVKANKTMLLVSFSLQVEVESKGTCYYNSVWVDLAGGTVSKSVTGDCNEPDYYQAPQSDKKKIQFVFDAVNKSDEVGDIENNKLPDGTTMKITEHFGYYYVEVSSWSTFSHYKVDKGSGKISDAGHKHYDHDFMPEEKWEIIQ